MMTYHTSRHFSITNHCRSISGKRNTNERMFNFNWALVRFYLQIDATLSISRSSHGLIDLTNEQAISISQLLYGPYHRYIITILIIIIIISCDDTIVIIFFLFLSLVSVKGEKDAMISTVAIYQVRKGTIIIRDISDIINISLSCMLDVWN